MAGVTDFVMVRFASKPYGFMRVSHNAVVPWLELKGIQYTTNKSLVYYELPPDLQKYQRISPEVAAEIRPLATEVKKRLAALVWTKMAKQRAKLTEEELTLLVEAGIPIIL